jgi:23S rRNA pseudouridine2605 synthase
MAKRRTSKKSAARSTTTPGAQRLNKILAAAGLGSRRKVEELIEQGRVEIDGDIVTDLACKVDPREVKIKVDGSLLKKSRPVYFALNKPPGVLSTNYDPSGRMRVIDLVPDRDRVFCVGRLDQSSEGLMLLTNDGELAQRLAHPKFRIQKSYFVVVSGQMSNEELDKLRKGVHLAEGFARIDGATIKKHRKGCTEIEIVLSEGKNREIRRMLARAGHKVVVLRRIAIGPLRLGQMPVGASRTLTANEVKALYTASDPANRPKKKTAKKAPASANAKSPRATDDDDADDLLFADIGDDEEGLVSELKGGSGQGSVLGYDDEDSAQDRRPARKSASPKKQANARGRDRQAGAMTTGQPQKSKSSAARGRSPAGKKSKTVDSRRSATGGKRGAAQSKTAQSKTSGVGGRRGRPANSRSKGKK